MADITPPTISITSNTKKLKVGDTALITFSLNEDASDFVLSDIAVTGGNLSNFSGSGKRYSATFTPTENTNSSGSISVANYKFSDASGNANEDGSDQDNRLVLDFDTVIPTLTISSSKSIFAIGDTAIVSFTLSEPSTDFSLGDVVVSGGVLSNFVGSGANYTAIFTPQNGVSTSGSFSVAANTFSDLAGNFNVKTNVVNGVYLHTLLDPLEPKLNWVKLLGTIDVDSVNAISIGLEGSIYLVGMSNGPLDGQFPNGAFDAFVAKINANGTKVWTILSGSNFADYANGVVTSKDGSIYVSGSTYGSWEGQPKVGGLDAQITKYTPDGVKVWTKLFGSTGEDSANSLAVGTDGSIYIVGYSSGYLDGQKNAGKQDAFVTKFDPDGTKIWTRLLGDSENNIANSIAIGLDGSIYICGENTSIDSKTYVFSSDGFIAKFDPDGNKIWTQALASIGSDEANALTLGTDGAIYVCGTTTGANFDGIQNNTTAGFICKFLPDGTRAWSKLSYNSAFTALKYGQDGLLYAAGKIFGKNIDGQLGVSGNDILVTSYDADGVRGWARVLGSGSSDSLKGLSLGNDGSLFIVGDTYSDLYGEKNQGVYELYSGKGSTTTDAYLINLGLPDKVPPKISITSGDASFSKHIKGGESIVLNFSISESVNDFISSDVNVQGGTLSNFQGAGKNYSAKFTAAVEATSLSIYVGNGKFSDLSSNFNLDGTDADNLFSVTVLSPIVKLSANATSVNEGETVTIFLTSGESISGTSFPYKITGVLASDFSLGSLEGSVTVDDFGKATILIPIVADRTTEGQETLTLTVLTNSVSITINDKSIDDVRPSVVVTSDTDTVISGSVVKFFFSLSEPSTNFTVSDVIVNGGTLSNFSGSGTTYTALFTPTANSTTSGVVSVASGVFSDSAGNINSDGSDSNNLVSIAIDTVIPTAALGVSKTSLIFGESTTLNITLSEPSKTFTDSDIEVSGGSLSNFTGNGSSYSALFTPTANSTSNGTISIVSGVFTDTAGNSNVDGSDANNTVTLAVDTVVPTIALSAAKSSLIADDSMTLTFTLSEASTTFTASDVTVAGGTLSDFTGSGTSYTALFTPTSNSSTNGIISIANGVFTDTAGNTNADGSDSNNNITLVIDTVIPTIAVSSNKSSLQGGDSATLNFTLSEASTNFVASDITVAGGTLSNFSGSETSYTATFTLVADSAVTGSVTISNGVFTDTGGNKNADGSDANNSVSFLRIPTITNEVHTLSVIVDKNVLGPDAVLLKGLKESLILTNGTITKHIIEYAGLTFDYDQIDSLITTVTRDVEFTAEFTKEINDYLGNELNIPFSSAVKLVGAANIDGVILSVAGADGNYVG